jgi:hypothetical protein
MPAVAKSDSIEKTIVYRKMLMKAGICCLADGGGVAVPGRRR